MQPLARNVKHLTHGTMIAYVGPSLPLARRIAHAGLQYRDPVAVGDLYRLAQQPKPPARIAIIDGYFERMAAVWHKEILLCLERGIAVYGGASMGALRAAELAPFGMIAVGAIASWYAGGAVTADDEVAVAHLPKAHGYLATSEPLVNFRATLAVAVQAQRVTRHQAKQALVAAQAIHYQTRTRESLTACLSPAGARYCLANWQDQKYSDAQAVIGALIETGDARVKREAAASAKVNPVPRTWALQQLGLLLHKH